MKLQYLSFSSKKKINYKINTMVYKVKRNAPVTLLLSCKHSLCL